MGNFTERCPHCDYKLKELHDKFVNADYAMDFSFDCPLCDNTIAVHVHQVPEFELSKAQTDEEYAAFIKDLAKTKHLCAGCNYRLINDDVSLCKTCSAKVRA